MSFLLILCCFNFRLVSSNESNQNKAVNFIGVDEVTEFITDEKFFKDDSNTSQKKTNFTEGKRRNPKKRLNTFQQESFSKTTFVCDFNKNNFHKRYLFICLFSILLIYIVQHYWSSFVF
ncbi:hypothetical protein [Alphaproteobacteria bacterium endosymbiont of Tiliacea citrago]|uniref:hypothetical protein n=1 Tax=Alphaproteobacteria bacterium endosymbiont of Tiliacea citrago TaxID=3077944 RepID=UPI00313E2A08